MLSFESGAAVAIVYDETEMFAIFVPETGECGELGEPEQLEMSELPRAL